MVLKPTLRSSKHTTRKQFPRSVFVPWCFYVAEGHAFDTCPNLWWHVAFKVLRNGLLRYKLNTCPNLWWHSCSKCFAIDSFGTWHMPKPVMTFVSKSVYGMDCIGTYFTHVQSCDVIVLKVLRGGLLRYILHTCPKLWCNPCSKCYGVDCFGTYFTHAQSCDVTRVQSATEWTASVHPSHTSKAVM